MRVIILYLFIAGRTNIYPDLCIDCIEGEFVPNLECGNKTVSSTRWGTMHFNSPRVQLRATASFIILSQNHYVADLQKKN